MDSGAGGILVLNLTKILLPNENLLYFADFLNSPYGNKKPSTISNIMFNNIKHLNNHFKIKLYVIACNTATATSLDYLRRNFPDQIFVGIEPAIKPAFETNYNTLVLSTYTTFRYSKLIKKYRELNSQKLFFYPFKSLAKTIDKNLSNQSNLLSHLAVLKKYKKHNIKNVVLGCTHFNLIKEQISSILSNVEFFESSGGVVKRIQQLLIENDLINSQNELGKVDIISSSNNSVFISQLQKLIIK